MIIRKIKSSDYQSIYELIKNELGYKDILFDSLCKRREQMNKNPNYEILVALIDNQIVGFISLMQGIALEMEGTVIRIIGLAVKNTYQGKGIGSSLIRYSEDYAKNISASIITLNSGMNRITAHEFYEKMGYIKKGYSFIKQCE